MIYFLINNNYHLYDLNLLYDDIKSYELSLIQIPHALDPVEIDSRFKNIYLFPRFESLNKYRINISLLDRMKEELNIQPQDILLVYTEFEFANQFIINLFNKIGASVYLLEDGMGTQHVFNLQPQKKRLKVKVKEWLLRHIYGMKYVKLVEDGNTLFPVMDDTCFKGALLYNRISTLRNIPIIPIKNNTKKIESASNSIIFLNQDLYNGYDNLPSYLSILELILSNFTEKFHIVYFKFHPREKNFKEYFLIERLVKEKGCIIISSTEAIETIVNKYDIGYAASFFSTAIRNLAFMGIEPIFLYHLFPCYNYLPAAKNITAFLRSMEYNFPHTFDDINIKYKSGIVTQGEQNVSIADVLSGI